MKSQRKTNLGILAGLVLAASELSAQTISWGSSLSVPLSPASTALMTALFLLGGLWVLAKKRRQFPTFVAVALLGTGAYTLSVKAGVAPLSISTSTGTQHLNHGANVVQNDYAGTVTITEIDLQSCTLGANMEPVCHVGLALANGESCNLNIVCD